MNTNLSYARDELVFRSSESLTLGVELELQVIDLSDFDLASSASDLLKFLETQSIPATLSPELTESMIELSVGIFRSWLELRTRLREVRDQILEGGSRLNLGICGGGAHPFQRWQQRRIFDNSRFQKVSALYGYLAKQFTVFGQHVHVGCEDSDSAIWLLHALARYVPHFIALSASSPFFQGSSTSFHSSRLHSISAFPLSGRCPFYKTWKEFQEQYYWPMVGTGVVRSMKDFYWDIRPKPEYGTIELRICDTPLTVDRASLIAGYLQAIAARLLAERPSISEADYMVYSYNRFQACRFGFDGMFIDPTTHEERTVREDFAKTIEWLAASKRQDLELASLLIELQGLLQKPTQAEELLSRFRNEGTIEDVVQFAVKKMATNDS